jgi:hypothetical protein
MFVEALGRAYSGDLDRVSASGGQPVLDRVRLVDRRARPVERCVATLGNVGPAVSHEILDVVAMITGMP